MISSDGFGTCGELFGFLTGGIGQEWRRGNLKVTHQLQPRSVRVNVARASRADVAHAARAEGSRLQQEGVRTIRSPCRRTPASGHGTLGGRAAPRSAWSPLTARSSRRRHQGPAAPKVTRWRSSRRVTRRVACRPATRWSASWRSATEARALPHPVAGLRAGAQRPRGDRRETVAVPPAHAAHRTVGEAPPARAGAWPRTRRSHPVWLPHAEGLRADRRSVGADADVPFDELPKPGGARILARIVRDGVPLPGRAQVAAHTTLTCSELTPRPVCARTAASCRSKPARGPAPTAHRALSTGLRKNGKTGVFRKQLGKTLKVYLRPPARACASRSIRCSAAVAIEQIAGDPHPMSRLVAVTVAGALALVLAPRASAATEVLRDSGRDAHDAGLLDARQSLCARRRCDQAGERRRHRHGAPGELRPRRHQRRRGARRLSRGSSNW